MSTALPEPDIQAVEDRAEYVYRCLRSEILSGELPPGAVLSQVQIAARLKTSRTPLREALKRLLAENLVVGDFNQRMRVSALNLQDFDQIYALRIAIEPMAVAAAMPTWTTEERRAITESVETMESAIAVLDVVRFRQAHRVFHLGLTKGSGERVERVLEDLWDNSERYRLTYLHHDYDNPASPAPGQLRQSQLEHRAILNAAMAGDAIACGHELLGHMRRSIEIVYEGAAVRPRARVSPVALNHVEQSAELPS